MDRLASTGVLFRHAFCTTPSCSASRSVVLTGRHNHANGQFGHAHLPANFHTHPESQSIPRLLQRHGFTTGVIGKLHVNPPDVYPWDYTSSGGEDGGTRDVWGMAQKGREFFRQTKDRPFYLHVGFGDPHRASGPGLFANHRDYPQVQKHKYSPSDVLVPPFLPDTPEVRAELAEYYESIDRLDQGIGFFLEALKESGRAEETLVIYMSDHGMPFPGAKGSPYDSGLHVPLIVRTPTQGRRGIANEALANWTDILPTVLDWAGAESGDYQPHGRSLLPILEQERPSGWDEICFSHTFHEIVNYFPFRGIRTRQYKYTQVLFPELTMPLPSDLWSSPTWQGMRWRKLASMGQRATRGVLHHAGEELYDIGADPTETRNLAKSPQHAGALNELREKVRRFRQETSDPWLGYFERIERPAQPLKG
jgi:N-sulfoglucosamine sulfohydrolase